MDLTGLPMRAGWLFLFVAFLLPAAVPPQRGEQTLNRAVGSFSVPRTVGASPELDVAFEATGAGLRTRTRGYRIDLDRRGALITGSAPGASLRMSLVGSDAVVPVGRVQVPGRANHIRGADPAGWEIGLERYATARFENAYPRVDWVFRGEEGAVAYDFVVAPGGDPGRIRLLLDGADEVTIDDSGKLRVRVGTEELVHEAPRIFQISAEGKQRIDGGFVLEAPGVVGFRLGTYDPALELVIDPAIGFSSYLGGIGSEDLPRIALTADRAVVIAGTTGSQDLQAGVEAEGRAPAAATLAGDVDAFVARFDPSGSRLEFLTYLGGSGMDRITGVAVAADGAVWIAGQTASVDFPGEPGLLRGLVDAFVARISADGTAVEFARFLGGAGVESGAGIAVDAEGFVVVTGYTASSDFGVYSAAQPELAGGSDAFVVRLDASGRETLYATYLGGAADDAGFAVATGADGSVYVTGTTASPDFPRVNPLQATPGGEGDAFVVRLRSSGEVAYATNLGGSDSDVGLGIAVDEAGAAYITGQTYSPDFPTLNPFQQVLGGASDAFVIKLSADGRTAQYSTFLGGGEAETGGAIAVDGSGNAHVTGMTASPDFPTKNSLQPFFGGGGDVFVTRLNDRGSDVAYSTYSGGGGADAGVGIVVDGTGNGYVVGQTSSEDFPTFNPVQPALSGPQDAFVTKYCLSLVFPEQRDLPSAGGSDTFAVTTPSGCVWIAFSEASWIRLTTPNVVAGPADVGFELEPNATGLPRAGVVNIAGAQVVVVQEPATDCDYEISPASENFYMEGGVGRINVRTRDDCAWSAASLAPWITLIGMERGTGAGVVSYTVDANRTGRQRAGSIIVAGQTFVVFDWLR